MPNLYDLLSDADKKKVDSWQIERMNPKHEPDIPPELYTYAEAGYYWGWPAIEAIMRGYIEKTNAKGEVEKIPITLKDVIALCRAARKVEYNNMLDRGRIATAANIAGMSRDPENAWNANTRSYQQEAKL